MCGVLRLRRLGNPEPAGDHPQRPLPELSGLASSRLHAGTLYAHNDSGDSARFFAIDESARSPGQIDAAGRAAIDWEDIAVGRCPTGWCVFVADIGDNDLNRTECTIYRVPEPETLPTNGSTITATYERLPFVYPDGWHNAETLLVDPQSQRIFVVTKETSVPSRVYELPTPVTPTSGDAGVRRHALRPADRGTDHRRRLQRLRRSHAHPLADGDVRARAVSVGATWSRSSLRPRPRCRSPSSHRAKRSRMRPMGGAISPPANRTKRRPCR